MIKSWKKRKFFVRDILLALFTSEC